MAGKILEFSADKYFDAGKAEGREEGIKEGEQNMIKLVNVLIANGRSDELERVANDDDYKESLYKKYKIV